MARITPSLVIFTACLLPATLAYRPGDEICVVNAENDCSLSEIKPSQLDGSTLVYPGGMTRCAFDNWSSPATNYSANATYFFQVFPAPNAPPKPKKLLLYLQGGGACLDKNSCSFALQCASGATTFNADAKAQSSGVLNRSDPTNLFNDWNIVHVPYCTGDIHIGNAVHDGADAGYEFIFRKPACLNQNQSLHQNGYVNAQSAFDWAYKNFPDIDQLALSGTSSGALAVQIFAKVIAEKWNVQEKKTKFSVLVDSYVGVAPPERPASILVKYANACTLPWGLPSDIVQDCENQVATTSEIAAHVIKATSSFADWFYADSMGDYVQRVFYEILNQGILAYPFQKMLSAHDLYTNMTKMLESYKNDTPKIAWFFESGERHGFFTLDNRTEISSADGKDTLGGMVRSILAGNFTYDIHHSGNTSLSTPSRECAHA